MWPLISSFRISSACEAASSGVSANLTPPAFMRPPVSTCDLMTVGPPISSATRRASSADVAKPWGEVGMPALATIFRDSYSKNLMRGGSLSWAPMRLAITLVTVLLLFPATAAAAEVSISLEPNPGVQYGTAHNVGGKLVEGTAPLAGQAVELRGRAYPYDGDFVTLGTATTDTRGAYSFKPRFDRNMQLQVAAPGPGDRQPPGPRLRLPAPPVLLQGPLERPAPDHPVPAHPGEREAERQDDLLPRSEEGQGGGRRSRAPSRSASARGASRPPRP